MMMPNRLTSLSNSSSTMILFWITIISIIVQASLLPLADDETDKRTGGHNIMRFGRQAGHNILRFGRTPGHNIMRFGKREESNSAPGSSYEMISEPRFPSDYQRSGYNNYGLFDLPPPPPPQPQPSSLTPYNTINNNNNHNVNNLNSNNGFDLNSSPYLSSLPELVGQPSPINSPLPFISQRSLTYQQAKKGRPETDHVIMRFG